MNPTDNPFIPEEHFDVLLRQALLGTTTNFTESNNNSKNFEAMATHIFSNTVFTGNDNKSIVEKLVKDFEPRKNNFRLNIFLLSLFTIATIALVIFFTSKNKILPTQNNFIPVIQKINSPVVSTPVAPQQLMDNPVPVTNPVIAAFRDSIKKKEDSAIAIQLPAPHNYVPTTLHIPMDYAYTEEEDVPILTDAQKKQTAKDKLKIIKDVFRKHEYTYFPYGKTKVNGVMRTVETFLINNAETTNFEYRTFLNDLLVQGKNEDYFAARPVQGLWATVSLPEFDNYYFSSEKFNDFPAANMTRKGAELYCQWLTDAFKEAAANKEIKDGGVPTTFRLPFDVEWIFAARAGDSIIQYPWGKFLHNGTQNIHGCYLCDFNYTLSKAKLYPENTDTKSCITTKPPVHAVVTTASRSIDSLVTVPVYSYNPNATGSYCTMGNVSEMVWTSNPDNPNEKGAARSMGGNWNSDVDNVLIEAPEQYVGVTDARPYIGFRIVMVYK